MSDTDYVMEDWSADPRNYRDHRFEDDPCFFQYGPAPITCSRCGNTGLNWRETSKGFRLYKGDEIHVCKSLDIARKEFRWVDEE